MEKFEIRDLRNGDWHWVYNVVLGDPHLTPAEKLVYSSLATFGGCKEIRPSFQEIAKRANLSERMAAEGVKKLVSIGYLDIESGGGRHKTNIYYLLKKPKGCKLCIVSKVCTKQQETMQTTARNYANPAPQLNKELNKEEDKNLNFLKNKETLLKAKKELGGKLGWKNL